MSRARVLFLCGRNLRRSPTAAAIYANDPRVEVRSAGVSPSARRRVSARDLEWATVVAVMERKHAARIRERFGDLDLPNGLPKIVSLEIEDEYEYLDPELVERIRQACSDLIEELADD